MTYDSGEWEAFPALDDAPSHHPAPVIPSTPAAVLPKPREPRLITIPAGSKPTQCSACGKTLYFSAKSPKTGKHQPVSIDHPAAVEPTDKANGFGISHFADCPAAERFRRKKA